MRSPLAVKRSHTSQKRTNTRKNRGNVAKNAKRRQKEWAQSTIHHDKDSTKTVTSNNISLKSQVEKKEVQFPNSFAQGNATVGREVVDSPKLSRNKKNKKKVEEETTKLDCEPTVFSVVKDKEECGSSAPCSKESLQNEVVGKMIHGEIQKRCKDAHPSHEGNELGPVIFDSESTAEKKARVASMTDHSVEATDSTAPQKSLRQDKEGCITAKYETGALFEDEYNEEPRVTKDNFDDITDAEVAALNLSSSKSDSFPIQVHEVTSTYCKEAEKNTDEFDGKFASPLSVGIKDVSPTRFAQNVQKLVEHTMKKTKHDIVEIDPSVKMTIDAQLLKLSEKKAAVVTEQKNYISPLPLELHYSRPSTPVNRERQYKLLPKDIIFCSGLIDSHGGNYSAMAADPRNIYKETARGLQRKIRIFKESPHFQTYLRAKEEGKTVEEILRLEDN